MAAYTTIDDPSAYFKVQLYTGNGSANHAITFDDTDTDMQPDLVWIKNRDATDSHCLFDAVRGATKVLHADTAAVESTDTDTLDSFTSDGFQVDADVKVNTNTEKYAAWCWSAGTGSGSSNTTGDINTTTTSVNTTSKFSMSTYEAAGSTGGDTIGHGLSAVPHLIIVKCRTISTGSEPWVVYHHKNTSAPETDYFSLDTHDGTTDDDVWADTAPTSSVIKLGKNNRVNSGAANKDEFDYVMYAWSEVQGFSKFGSYTGNGNADGTFVFCGFRPKIILFKRTDRTGDNWQLFDTERSPHNEALNRSQPSENTADYASGNWIDILSNGFKQRGTPAGMNASGGTVVYMAWAESPFVNSEGVPCNAR